MEGDSHEIGRRSPLHGRDAGRSLLRLSVAAAATLAILGLPAGAASTPADGGYGERPAAAFEFPVEPDVVVDHRNGRGRDQTLRTYSGSEIDGLVIGVIPPQPVPDAARRATSARLLAEQTDVPTQTQPRSCSYASQPQATSLVAFFGCGDDPQAVRAEPVAGTTGSDASTEERLTEALAAVASGPSDAGRSRGLRSPIEPIALGSVSIAGSTAHISFAAAPVIVAPGGGATFVAQIVATVAQVPELEGVTIDAGGDCLAFAHAVGGDSCVTYAIDGHLQALGL